MAPADPLPHLLSIDELAEHLGVTVRHIRRLIAEHRVPYLKVGRLVRFDPGDVTKWLADARVDKHRTA
jgi:excisionase family DNA binding protein